MRLGGEIRFADFSGDGVADWLVSRGECFNKPEGEPEVRSHCIALVDGQRWVPLWRKNVPRFGRFSPLVVGRWVVVDVAEPIFTAFDTTRVDNFWEFRIDGEHSAPMTAVGGRVLVVVGGDHVYLIDPEERRAVWDVRLWSPARLQPVVVDGHAAIATQREVNVLDLSTGRVIWRFQGEASSVDAVAGEGLYIGYRGPQKNQLVTAVSLLTGERLWTKDRALPADAQLIVAEDQIFAFAAGAITALDRQNGAFAWEVKLKGRPTPLGADRQVVAAIVQAPGAPQEVHAYDRETGKRLWVKTAAARRYEPNGKLVNGVLVLWSREGASVGTQQGLVEGLDALTSRPRWSNESAEKIVGLLGVDAEHVRLQSERGYTVLRTQTGEEVQRHPAVALAREGKPLSERLRYLVYAVPSAIILMGIGVWIRRLLRRRH